MQRKSLAVFVICLFALSFSCVAVAEPTTESLQAFVQWIQQHKIHTKFNLGKFEGAGFGGVARVDIKEGEPLLMVPSGVIISNSRIKAESFLKDFNEWSGQIAFEPLLAWIMYESTNPQSPWKAYLDVLPTSFPTHPLSWTEEELAETVGTGLDTTTAAIKQLLKASYDNLEEKLVKPNKEYFPDWSFEKFVWAFQVINSRSWTLSQPDGSADIALVPLADMLNHKPGHGIGGLSQDKTYFSINATVDIKTGEQVYDFYGPKSNYDLLSTYGFVLEDNPDDAMTLQFTLKPSNLVHSIVEPLLRSVDANYKSIKIRPNKIPVELLRVFRLSVMEFSELEHVSAALQGKGVSLKNELKAFRAAISSLSSMLQQFKTTIAEDNEILARSDISANLKNAVYLRKTQKEIIANNVMVLGKMWENILLSGELLGGVAI